MAHDAASKRTHSPSGTGGAAALVAHLQVYLSIEVKIGSEQPERVATRGDKGAWPDVRPCTA